MEIFLVCVIILFVGITVFQQNKIKELKTIYFNIDSSIRSRLSHAKEISAGMVSSDMLISELEEIIEELEDMEEDL